MVPSHYDILGVAPGVGDDAVRTAYLAMVRAVHPDSSPRSRSDLAPIVAAYRALRTAEDRARYDEMLTRGEYARLLHGEAGRQLALRTAPASHGRIVSTALLAVVILLVAIFAVGQWTPDADRTVASPHENFAGSTYPPGLTRVETAADTRARAALDVHWIITIHGPSSLAVYSDLCYLDARSTGSWLQCEYCAAFDGEVERQSRDGHFAAAANAARRNQCQRAIVATPD